jgi:predicted ATPase/class 3 adenylate cyclase
MSIFSPGQSSEFPDIHGQAEDRRSSAGSIAPSRRAPPTGTVTLLFTDIEASTHLAQQWGKLYSEVLAEHNKLLRDIFEPANGFEVDTQGDAFFVAFERATDAVESALTAQKTLAKHAWREGGVVRVRMGLHTAEPQLSAGKYVGLDVIRAKRLCELGHGGQILLTESTRQLIQQSLPPGVSLRDLGEHRFKNFARPEPVYQLVSVELPADYPPLNTFGTTPNNLPLQLTSFIGREREVLTIKRLLAPHNSPSEQSGHARRAEDNARAEGHEEREGGNPARLLTLTGVGGTGKTRLALRVAADVFDAYPDGVWLVRLASLNDPAHVPQAVASVIGVREQPGQPLVSTLETDLRAKHLLLILDDCEHLIDACAQLADSLLRACPNLRIIATSREVLSIAGEMSFRVPSLSLPPLLPPVGAAEPVPGQDQRAVREDLASYDVETWTQHLGCSEAMQLFVDRALATDSDFHVTSANSRAAAQICRQLDGIPLAIELAAARVKTLTVEQIATRLSERFRLLTGGSRIAPRRHQTLRALVDWSYDLLSEKERTLLRRISVFSGGCTLEAAEDICADRTDRRAGEQDDPGVRAVLDASEILDLISRLVDKSLIVVDQESNSQAVRYRMLETIRQYAVEKLLESGEGESMRARHLTFFVRLAQKAESRMHGTEQLTWFERLETEHDNLGTALDWSLEEGSSEEGVRLAAAMRWFWYMRGYWREGREW